MTREARPPLVGPHRPGWGSMRKPRLSSEDAPRAGGGALRGPNAGFTLLEVLIVLALSGMVLVLLHQGLRTAAALREARLAVPSGELEPVHRTLRRLIEGMDPDAADFAAGPRALSFATRMTVPEEPGVAQAVNATVLLDDATHRLVVRWTPRAHIVWFGAPPPRREETLLTGVQSLAFGYWTPDQAGGNWRSDWRGEGTPPLIRVRLLFLPGDFRRWPDLVVAPRLDRPFS